MNNKGKSSTIIAVALIAIAILLGYALIGPKLQQTSFGSTTTTSTSAGTPGQNPSISYAFVDALTGQSVTANVVNYKKADDGTLLGSSYAGTQGTTVIPLITNTTGYIAAVQPQYTVAGGNQVITGKLYKFANQTIQLYNNAGTATIGGTLGTTGNDTAFSTQANNRIILTGNTYKSSGRMFVVFEISTTTNVSSVTLSKSGSVVPTVSVPNCYSNTLSGTPYRAAWELPAIIGGAQETYNLQTLSANGNTVQGKAVFTIYNEKDAVDSLTGAYITSGICDSNNVGTTLGSQTNTYYYN
jgi:hypothetical protein